MLQLLLLFPDYPDPEQNQEQRINVLNNPGKVNFTVSGIGTTARALCGVFSVLICFKFIITYSSISSTILVSSAGKRTEKFRFCNQGFLHGTLAARNSFTSLSPSITNNLSSSLTFFF